MYGGLNQSARQGFGEVPEPGRSVRPHRRPSAATAERLNDAIKRLRARLRAESGQQATGFTPTQLGLLAAVVQQGPITAARLAALEHVTAQAMTQNLAVLKAADLVRAEPDPNDGRKKLISAEPSAAKLVQELTAGRADYLTRALEQLLDSDERAALAVAVELLERLADGELRDRHG